MISITIKSINHTRETIRPFYNSCAESTYYARIFGRKTLDFGYLFVVSLSSHDEIMMLFFGEFSNINYDDIHTFSSLHAKRDSLRGAHLRKTGKKRDDKSSHHFLTF